MSYRLHPAPTLMLFGYDPVRDLPPDHLARLVEMVVETTDLPHSLVSHAGHPAFDPSLCAQVLVYGYATGVRSSRQLERHCSESLPSLFLTRGDTPSYRTLCRFRVHHSEVIEAIWTQLFAVAGECGMKRMGRIVIDSSKFRADAGPESVVKATEFEAVLAELKPILQEAEAADAHDHENTPAQTRTGHVVDTQQRRDLVRRVRTRLSRQRQSDPAQPVAEAQAEASAEKPLGPRMLPRLQAAIAALETAQKEGETFACLTDPDARMMGEGHEMQNRQSQPMQYSIRPDD